MGQKLIKNIFFHVCVTGLVISSTLMIWISPFSSFRIVFGTIYMFFIPGFFILELLFPSKEHDERQSIQFWVERITLSIAVSFILVPFIIALLYRLGIALSPLSIFLEIFGIILISLIFRWIRYLSHYWKDDQKKV